MENAVTTRNSTRLPFPTPSELWGDYKVEQWSRQENGLLSVHYQILASAIVYTDKNITDRIHSLVRETIRQTKAGELSPVDALERTNPKNVFSQEEWNKIKETAETQGKMMAAFFIKDGSVN